MAKLYRVLIAFVVLVSGCVPNSLSQFTADVNGKPFKAIFATWEENSTTNLIFAVNSQFKAFTINVSGVLEEGDYVLGEFGSEATGIYVDIVRQNLYVSQSGNLTITSKTSEGITGTFDMVLVNINPLGGGEPIEVVNGEFDLPPDSVPES
jgi:hypothetical protein